MVIRVVEPVQFTRRIVAERRPSSFAGSVVIAADKPRARGTAACIAVCVLILVALAFSITYGLQSFLQAWGS